jgi:hypothetical protein
MTAHSLLPGSATTYVAVLVAASKNAVTSALMLIVCIPAYAKLYNLNVLT